MGNAIFSLTLFSEIMRRLKKRIYFGLWTGALCVLSVVRMCNPQVISDNPVLQIPNDSLPADTICQSSLVVAPDTATEKTEPVKMLADVVPCEPVFEYYSKMPRGPHADYRPIRSVHSYRECFPDLQDVQIVAARKWGVSPVKNRTYAEKRKSELVYIGANPYFDIDQKMNQSIPYLVPRASQLLHDIGRNFLDSLYVKGVPLHKIIVSSVLRTEDDVKKLRRYNVNASEQSCHRFATTFDICYNRYTTVVAMDGTPRRAVQNDTLKWVLSEVLRDLRQQKRCYVKYELRQACFHITVR